MRGIDNDETLGRRDSARSAFLHRRLLHLFETGPDRLQEILLENDDFSNAVSHPQRITEDDFEKTWQWAIRTAAQT